MHQERNRRVCLTLIVLIATAIPSLLAQAPTGDPSRDWEVSFFGGLSSADDHSSLLSVEGLDQTNTVFLDYSPGYAAGVRITENLGDHLSAELDYTFANQPMAFRGLRPTLPRLDLDHNVHSAVYSMLFSPMSPRKNFRPFAMVGAGVSYFHISKDSKDASVRQGVTLKDRWKFLLTFGVGAKYRFSRSWGIRFDARDQVSGIPDYGLPPTSQFFQNQISPGFRPDGLLHNWKFSVGVNYYFKGL